MQGYDLLGVPIAGECPIYLFPVWLWDAAWLIGLCVYFVNQRDRSRWGLPGALAAWALTSAIIGLTSNVVFRCFPPMNTGLALAGLLMGSIMAGVAGSALTWASIRYRAVGPLFAVSLAFLLPIYLVGQSARVSEDRLQTTVCINHLSMIYAALDAYRDDHGDYPPEDKWQDVVRSWCKDAKSNHIAGIHGMILGCPVTIQSEDYDLRTGAVKPGKVSYRYHRPKPDSPPDTILVYCDHPSTRILPAERVWVTVEGNIRHIAK